MEVCEVCGREFGSRRGLRIHLAKTHKIHKARGSLFTKTARRFFMLLGERRWTDADRLLDRLRNGGIKEGWMRGYIHALEGMLLALRVDHSSPKPYILDVIGYNRSQLRDAKKEFNRLLRMPMKTEFDVGYFRAWLNYINYLLNKPKVR